MFSHEVLFVIKKLYHPRTYELCRCYIRVRLLRPILRIDVSERLKEVLKKEFILARSELES